MTLSMESASAGHDLHSIASPPAHGKGWTKNSLQPRLIYSSTGSFTRSTQHERDNLATRDFGKIRTSSNSAPSLAIPGCAHSRVYDLVCRLLCVNSVSDLRF